MNNGWEILLVLFYYSIVSLYVCAVMHSHSNLEVVYNNLFPSFLTLTNFTHPTQHKKKCSAWLLFLILIKLHTTHTVVCFIQCHFENSSLPNTSWPCWLLTLPAVYVCPLVWPFTVPAAWQGRMKALRPPPQYYRNILAIRQLHIEKSKERKACLEIKTLGTK